MTQWYRYWETVTSTFIFKDKYDIKKLSYAAIISLISLSQENAVPKVPPMCVTLSGVVHCQVKGSFAPPTLLPVSCQSIYQCKPRQGYRAINEWSELRFKLTEGA